MPLTHKGEEILGKMRETYESDEKAKAVLYASKNKGTITGIDSAKLDAILAKCDDFSTKYASGKI